VLGPAHPVPAQASAAPVAAMTTVREPARREGNAFAPVITIARDARGRFSAAGTINGRSIDMLVDTGADLVAVPAEAAAGLGISVAPDQFRPILRTASGPANGARVRIDSLDIDGHGLRDVDAVVVEGLDRVLLGQSALRRLGRVSIVGDRMEIGGD